MIQELRKKIDDLQTQIDRIQEQCSHPDAAVTRVAKSDTGNYDRTQDAYWYECECKLCEKRWTEDQ